MTFLVAVLVIPLSVLFNGWAICNAWNWFVPPVTGWTRLGVLQAFGIAIVVQILFPRRYRSREEQEQSGSDQAVQVVTHAAVVLLTLGLGWLVHEVAA